MGVGWWGSVKLSPCACLARGMFAPPDSHSKEGEVGVVWVWGFGVKFLGVEFDTQNFVTLPSRNAKTQNQ